MGQGSSAVAATQYDAQGRPTDMPTANDVTLRDVSSMFVLSSGNCRVTLIGDDSAFKPHVLSVEGGASDGLAAHELIVALASLVPATHVVAFMEASARGMCSAVTDALSGGRAPPRRRPRRPEAEKEPQTRAKVQDQEELEPEPEPEPEPEQEQEEQGPTPRSDDRSNRGNRGNRGNHSSRGSHGDRGHYGRTEEDRPGRQRERQRLPAMASHLAGMEYLLARQSERRMAAAGFHEDSLFRAVLQDTILAEGSDTAVPLPENLQVHAVDKRGEYLHTAVAKAAQLLTASRERSSKQVQALLQAFVAFARDQSLLSMTSGISRDAQRAWLAPMLLAPTAASMATFSANASRESPVALVGVFQARNCLALAYLLEALGFHLDHAQLAGDTQDAGTWTGPLRVLAPGLPFPALKGALDRADLPPMEDTAAAWLLQPLQEHLAFKRDSVFLAEPGLSSLVKLPVSSRRDQAVLVLCLPREAIGDLAFLNPDRIVSRYASMLASSQLPAIAAVGKGLGGIFGLRQGLVDMTSLGMLTHDFADCSRLATHGDLVGTILTAWRAYGGNIGDMENIAAASPRGRQGAVFRRPSTRAPQREAGDDFRQRSRDNEEDPEDSDEDPRKGLADSLERESRRQHRQKPQPESQESQEPQASQESQASQDSEPKEPQEPQEQPRQQKQRRRRSSKSVRGGSDRRQQSEQQQQQGPPLWLRHFLTSQPQSSLESTSNAQLQHWMLQWSFVQAMTMALLGSEVTGITEDPLLIVLTHDLASGPAGEALKALLTNSCRGIAVPLEEVKSERGLAQLHIEARNADFV
jgi:outer membrane biosynthesis protein TonB